MNPQQITPLRCRRATVPVTTQVQDDCCTVSGCAPEKVELRGIEPLTYSMRTSRATNCAIAPGTVCAAVTYLLGQGTHIDYPREVITLDSRNVRKHCADPDSHRAREAAALLHVDARGIEPPTNAV